MAERRMFAKTIIDSDAFLDMPLTTQALYFHLAMRADDEGFINNPKKISRMIGASEDELKVLIAKRFIIPFESGIVVIKHWRIHNYIRGDRLNPTPYQDERAELEIKDNGAYTLLNNDCQLTDNCQTVDSQASVNCPSTDSQMSAQVRLGKDRIDKDSIGKSISSKSDDDFDAFWSAYPKKVGKQVAQKAFKKINVDIQTLINAIEQQKKSKQWKEDNGKYIPNPATWLNQGRWEDELEEDKPFQNPWDDPHYYDIPTPDEFMRLQNER